LSRYRYGKKKPKRLTSTEFVRELVRQNEAKAEEDFGWEDPEDFEDEVQEVKSKIEELEKDINDLDDIVADITQKYWSLAVSVERLTELL
jgi:archaellum component FlaC